MRKVFTALFLITLAAFGGEPGIFVEQPNFVGKITETLVASKLDHLTPHNYRDGDRQFSYQMKSVSYLGTIERGSEKFILATALFFRSSAQGSDYPPARGHGYLLCLSPQLLLISHCRLDLPDVDLAGTAPRRQKVDIGDFAATDETTRRRGFLIDGDDFLPYPFVDKLPDPQAPPAKNPLGEQDAPSNGG